MNLGTAASNTAPVPKDSHSALPEEGEGMGIAISEMLNSDTRKAQGTGNQLGYKVATNHWLSHDTGGRGNGSFGRLGGKESCHWPSMAGSTFFHTIIPSWSPSDLPVLLLGASRIAVHQLTPPPFLPLKPNTRLGN